MANWVGKSVWIAAPLIEAISDHVMAATALHGDDTPVPVLAPGAGKTKTGRLFDAIGQPLGDPEPLLDRRQQQYPGVRGHPPAVESNMHRPTHHRWQTRQISSHGGRELRCFRMIRIQQPNHNETNGLCRSRQSFHVA